jgi:DNA invertase Pin-like site-specific DNA recombinase
MMDTLRTGDAVVVWKLDRLTRSLKDPLYLNKNMGKVGARFRSLTENPDTTTAAGELMMNMVGSFAQFERRLLHERTMAGLGEARRNGRVGGRRPKLDVRQCAEIARLVKRARRQWLIVRGCLRSARLPSRV